MSFTFSRTFSYARFRARTTRLLENLVGNDRAAASRLSAVSAICLRAALRADARNVANRRLLRVYGDERPRSRPIFQREIINSIDRSKSYVAVGTTNGEGLGLGGRGISCQER